MGYVPGVAPGGGTVDQTARDSVTSLAASLPGTYAPKWQANTAYIAGQAVVLPDGTTGTAKTNFTTGATYSAANWNVASGGAAIDDTQASVSTVYSSTKQAATFSAKQLFDVTKYGAVVDGNLAGTSGTDNTTAIVAAVTAANAAYVASGVVQTVLVPASPLGLACRSGQIVLRSGVQLRLARGAYLRRSTAGTGATSGPFVTNTAFTPLRTGVDGVFTAANTTFTSATAAFTSADVGRSIAIVGAGSTSDTFIGDTLFAYITAVTDAQTVTVSLPALQAVSGKAWRIMGRDADISIVGEDGSCIDLGTNPGTNQTTAGCHIVLRNVDRCAVTGQDRRPLKIRTDSATPIGGAFSVFFYACTDWTASDLDFAVQSDGVHVQGRSSRFTVRNISGATGDDVVALVCPARGGIADGDFGDMQDFTISAVRATTTKNGVKLLPGQFLTEKYTMRRGLVDTVTTAGIGGSPVMLGLTNTNAAGGVSTAGPYYGGTIDLVTVRKVDNSSAAVLPVCNVAVGTVIFDQVGQVQVQGGSVVDKLVVENCHFVTSAANHVTIDNTGNPVVATTVRHVLLRNNSMDNSTGSGTPLITVTGAAVNEVVWDNCLVKQCAWSGGAYATTTAVRYRGHRVIAHTALVKSNASGVVTVLEAAHLSLPNTTSVSLSSGTARSRDVNFEADVTQLTKTAGDMAYNTNSAAGGGVGPVVSDGTVWKNLLTGVSA